MITKNWSETLNLSRFISSAAQFPNLVNMERREVGRGVGVGGERIKLVLSKLLAYFVTISLSLSRSVSFFKYFALLVLSFSDVSDVQSCSRMVEKLSSKL